MKMRCIWAVFLLLTLMAPIAVAKVVDQSPAGFTCQVVIDYPVDPDRLWQALTVEVDQWWNQDHTWSGDAGNLFLDGEGRDGDFEFCRGR